MIVLVLNCGSSSLKYQLFDMKDESVMAKGLVEKIGVSGSKAKLTHQKTGAEKYVVEEDIPNHTKAIAMVVEALTSKKHGVISDMNEIGVIGHRVVHGGPHFTSSVLITDDVMEELERVIDLAPLHNPPALIGMKACMEIMPGKPMVDVFDTAFHQTMEADAYIYALPYKYYEKYSIRRYGAHGTSHRYVSYRVAEMMGIPVESFKAITCHLGNGSSLAAVKGGKVVNTSMGFTPLAGVIMGTRTGDIDPAVVTYIMGKEGLSADEMNHLLNKQSGLLGVSGVSSDLRDVEKAAADGNKRAELSINMLNLSIARFIGSYMVELGGVDVLVFTAGIGENSVETRAAICEYLAPFGLELDEEANNCRGIEREITKPGSKIRAFIVPTNEELMIARDSMQIVSHS